MMEEKQMIQKDLLSKLGPVESLIVEGKLYLAWSKGSLVIVRLSDGEVLLHGFAWGNEMEVSLAREDILDACR
jgi:hypothetical protein